MSEISNINEEEKVKKERLEEARTELGKRLKAEIHKSGFKYRDISNGTKLSYGFLSDIANGRYFSTIETLYKICNFIGCDIKILLNGLEYWIKPEGIKFDSEDLTPKETQLYYDLLDLEIAKYGSTESVHFRKLPEGITLKSITAKDDSMELYGIHKNDIVTIGDGTSKPESDKIYCLIYKGEEMIRKIFVDGDDIVLIPFSRNKKYLIQKEPMNEVTILGLVSSATILLI